MKEFLKQIGITEEGQETTEGNYVVDLENSNHFNKIFSKLDKCDLVEENEDSSVVNVNITNILYIGEEYAINLVADFNQDAYKLVVTPLEDE